ncbi:MAG: type II toxin-antitoxin system Phd/YefM family antitoxin [Armatimonadota bacterium]
MSKISTVTAREQFSDVVNRAAYGKERVVLTRRGKDLAAVVPIEDVRLLEALEDQLDAEAVKEALADYALHGGTSWEQVKAEMLAAREKDT